MCPFHSMRRHMERLGARGPSALSPRAPLFPGPSGGVMTKVIFVESTRRVLRACGEDTTRTYEGVELERFTGHIARISGAQWLHNLGVPLQMLQVLGRWASLTILRYLQAAPLQTLPETAAQALQLGPVPTRLALAWGSAPQPQIDEGIVAVADSGDEDTAVEVPAPKRPRRQRAPDARPEPAGSPLGDSQPGVSREDLSSLQAEMGLLQMALQELQQQETYIVQGRSRKHHKIAVPERANKSDSWSTGCGWKYGFSRFHRAFSVASTDNQCRRC